MFPPKQIAPLEATQFHLNHPASLPYPTEKTELKGLMCCSLPIRLTSTTFRPVKSSFRSVSFIETDLPLNSIQSCRPPATVSFYQMDVLLVMHFHLDHAAQGAYIVSTQSG